MARKTTVKAFEEWIADEVNVAHVLQLISEGMTLQKASVAVKRPYTCLYGFFRSTPELEARYVAARKAFADRKMDENHEIASQVRPDKDHVAKAKLQIDVNTLSAKAYHRELWGERVQVDKNVNVTADAGLLGFAGELLAKRRPALTIEGGPGQGEGVVPPAALPAPASE